MNPYASFEDRLVDLERRVKVLEDSWIDPYKIVTFTAVAVSGADGVEATQDVSEPTPAADGSGFVAEH